MWHVERPVARGERGSKVAVMRLHVVVELMMEAMPQPDSCADYAFIRVPVWCLLLPVQVFARGVEGQYTVAMYPTSTFWLYHWVVMEKVGDGSVDFRLRCHLRFCWH